MMTLNDNGGSADWVSLAAENVSANVAPAARAMVP